MIAPPRRSTLFPYTTLFRSEVGGVQNTMTNLGASMGTALAGSIMIAAVASSFLTNIEQSSAIPARVKEDRSEEHTSELQSLTNLVCRLLLEKKKINREGLTL